MTKKFLKIKQYLEKTNVTLVAVSKTRTKEEILELYNQGQQVFGESKVQELVKKHETLPKDIKWHMIGHLQTNKVKYIASFVDLIHSVDSLKLLKEIDNSARKNNCIINCLLQIHIAKESHKFGFKIEDVKSILREYSFENVKIVGFMGMATNTNEEKCIKEEFSVLKYIYDTHKNKSIMILSMGMSKDYKIAIELGSNMVRIGSLLFS